MPFSPIPRGGYPSVTSLDPKKLKEKGITLVLADLDNTLVPYKVLEPSPEVAAWMTALKGEGIDLFLLSNSRKPGRAQKFAQQVGIPYQGHSGKPKKAGYLKAMERMGWEPIGRGCLLCSSSLSVWRAIPGGISATRQRPPSACWEEGGPSCECTIWPGGQCGELFQGPQILPGCSGLDRPAGTGLLRVPVR